MLRALGFVVEEWRVAEHSNSFRAEICLTFTVLNYVSFLGHGLVRVSVLFPAHLRAPQPRSGPVVSSRRSQTSTPPARRLRRPLSTSAAPHMLPRGVLLPAPRALSTTTTTTTVTVPAPLSAAELEALLRRDHYSASTRRFHSLLPLLSHPSLLLASALLLRHRSHPSPPLSTDPLPLPTTAAAPPSPSSHLCLILPSRLKGRPLPLPSLPLRLAMLCAASALDAVFAPRAATFAYRARHAAIRYLRSIPNATWFFRVAIPRQPFAPRHVRRLLDAISGKVDDPGFLDYLRVLFLSDAIAFELGGSELCRGLPQESELTSTLLNIFFDRSS